MILKLFLSVALILLLLLGWILVQHLSRAFAARHPELGPAREEGGGCQLCLCDPQRPCPQKTDLAAPATTHHPQANPQHPI